MLNDLFSDIGRESSLASMSLDTQARYQQERPPTINNNGERYIVAGNEYPVASDSTISPYIWAIPDIPLIRKNKAAMLYKVLDIIHSYHVTLC